MQVALDEPLDRAVERGREQHRLVLGLDAVEDLLHLGHEAHVGHAVGLVEDEHLDLVDGQLAALHEVDEPAGRADDDVDALAQGVDLGLHRHAAVDGADAAAAHLPSGASTSVTWLASSRVGTSTRPAGGRLGLADALEEREPEGEGLARAGLGLAAEVAAGEGVGDGEVLDREGLVDAVAREGATRSAATPSASKVVFMGEVLAFVVVCSCVSVRNGPARTLGSGGGGSSLVAARTSSDARRRRRAMRNDPRAKQMLAGPSLPAPAALLRGT